MATAYFLSRFFGFNAGGAAGLMAGGTNASAAIGTAEEAARPTLDGRPVAFAVTYLVGLITAVGTLSRLGPWRMRVNLREECRKLKTELSVDKAGPGVFFAYQHLVARSYAVPAGLEGTTPSELELAFAPARIFVERVRTGHGAAHGRCGGHHRPA